MEIDIEIPRISETIQRQATWAATLMTTWLARDSQSEVRESLPSRFTLRNDWTRRSIRFDAATKDNLTAIVKAPDYMAKQETGGRLDPKSRHLATPTTFQQKRRNKVSIRALRDQSNVFVFESKRGTSIRQRINRNRLRILYWLTDHQDYAARFDMDKQVEQSVRRNVQLRWSQALAQALSTSR
jgi:hypothetical protein